MKKGVRAAAATAAVLGGLIVAGTAPAKPGGGGGGGGDCTLEGFVFLYQGGAAEARGTVRCDTSQRWIHVFAVVTRDGAIVATGEHRCRKATTCKRTLAPLENPAGDQLWCVEVRGELAGGRTLGPQRFCEGFEEL